MTREGRYQVTPASALWFCVDCGAVVPIEARKVHDDWHGDRPTEQCEHQYPDRCRCVRPEPSVAHVANVDQLKESFTDGHESTALCGHTWTPTVLMPNAPLCNGCARAVLQLLADRRPLAELQARYLKVRGHTLSTADLPRDEALIVQAHYVLGEARELRAAVEDLSAPANVDVRQCIRHEIADVVLATVTLANVLGVTVEACIAEKTEHDRGRG